MDTQLKAEGTLIITEMAVFTLETDYSCAEMGYWFDNSRQIGNMSLFEMERVLILNEQSA